MDKGPAETLRSKLFVGLGFKDRRTSEAVEKIMAWAGVQYPWDAVSPLLQYCAKELNWRPEETASYDAETLAEMLPVRHNPGETDFTPQDLANHLGVETRTLNQWAKAQGLPTPGRGRSGFRYPMAHAIQIAEWYVSTGDDQSRLNSCRDFLRANGTEMEIKSK
jgi:hypothetical protein